MTTQFIEASAICLSMLARGQFALGVTTYLTGQVVLLGARTDGQLAWSAFGSPRCMGAACTPDGQTLWLCSQHHLWRLERSPLPPNHPFDSEYAPRISYVVGETDGHDVALPTDDESLAVFVSARYSCLARPGHHASFDAVWKPPFISKIAAEDRCHLNGLATKDGRPAYCTAVAETDFAGAWREHRSDGGIVLEIASGEVVCRGLSMPHSPRWHDGALYLMNSGAGEFGKVNLSTGKFEPIAFLPGYGRGMVFRDGKAIIGLSDCRENRTFQGLPLDDALKTHNTTARAGVFSVDLATGNTEELIRFHDPVREIYDIFILPETCQPTVLPADQVLWHHDATEDWTNL